MALPEGAQLFIFFRIFVKKETRGQAGFEKESRLECSANETGKLP